MMSFRRRDVVVALSVLGAFALVCGAGYALSKGDRARSERAVSAYLTALAHDGYDSAYALICRLEWWPDRAEFEQAERKDPVRSFRVEWLQDWSSRDGSGFVYRAHVTHASGVQAVRDIATYNASCVKYSPPGP
ncbi:hypothetical protein ABT369_37565 [Dactylosporangium sp. NPDC000244]|uniref:hypothetical protein n=1 Tax=Dactylosporangium sp. NPDC000244 TaxID=3154365 RepID=UPI003326772B